ncbi:hypothetical protein P153DRAFT_335165 [Dothidotthia symphoricarpi CBS 119687]|uniref:MARVEL domain-containing protein n=1 Tax=Dothidotthia symphoricarpi CBS 119687 TaxID=1392245 RepID=A0A6A6ALA1_9PLEO|nr:uncharacterized protein P153DRAFT_335165 [Dothidotthia symphoricarpi CBS 119687]KAF2132346.1 hypothetical protein P153DRAFT_335165 [Dothidotthia symphoricarpi CBS 119687]
MDSRRPVDGPAYGTPYEKPTGLLTRFVPDKLRHTALYRLFLRLTRVLQFISSVISLALFSKRVYKIYRLVNSLKTRRGVSGSFGAVEGILAAAVLYTLLVTLLSCIKKNSSPGSKMLRWLLVLLDLLFVGGFIAVSVITRPNGGKAGPRHCYNGTSLTNTNTVTGQRANVRDDTCDLPWGTFILAILSTVLHAITAAFHEVKDHHRKNKLSAEEKAMHHGHEGVVPPTAEGGRY